MIPLTKSKYLAGLQCPKRLWLTCHAPELGAAPDEALAARLDEGTEIGRRARELFPGGVLVDQEAWEHGEALARTRALMDDPAVPAIFEAAFEHIGVRVRVDVLQRLPDGWGIREVKSGTSVKDVHIEDAAIQRFVVEGCGVPVPSVEIVHVDGDYVRGEGDVAWTRFFERVDVSGAVAPLLPRVLARVEQMHATLARPDVPAIEPSGHCFTPYDCEFWAYCTREKPDDWIFTLPRLQPGRFEALRAAGIERIPDIADDFPLSELQARVREALQTGREFVSPGLAEALAPLGPPAAYLDFETANPGIPLYPGTRPYQVIAFQWSLHRADEHGNLSHLEFLARGNVDPRREFAETLLAAVRGGDEPIIVYSGFEGRLLGELASALPDLVEDLGRMRARLRDLLPVVRANIYHPAFRGSFSLKAVAPPLVPGFGYDDLHGVSAGDEAATALIRLAQGYIAEDAEAARIRSVLLVYCERDTMGLALLHRALAERASFCRE